jgi:hypothetical protein
MNVGWRLGPFGTFFLPLVVNDADKMTSVANLEDTRAMNIRVVRCAAIGESLRESGANHPQGSGKASWARMGVSNDLSLDRDGSSCSPRFLARSWLFCQWSAGPASP